MNCRQKWEGVTHHSDQILVPHLVNGDIVHQPTDDCPRAFGFAQVDLLDVQSIRIGVLLDCRNPSAFRFSLKSGRRKNKTHYERYAQPLDRSYSAQALRIPQPPLQVQLRRSPSPFSLRPPWRPFLLALSCLLDLLARLFDGLQCARGRNRCRCFGSGGSLFLLLLLRHRCFTLRLWRVLEVESDKRREVSVREG
jgi:hypothetical protein